MDEIPHLYCMGSDFCFYRNFSEPNPQKKQNLAVFTPFYIINSKTALEFPPKFSIFGRNIQ